MTEEVQAAEAIETSESTETQETTESTETQETQTTDESGATEAVSEEKKEEEPKSEGELLEELEGKLVKLKIDGAERNVPLRELVSKVQKAEAADRRFNEAAKIRKQAETVIRALKENPLGVLKHPALGFTEEQIQKMMEEAVYEKIQYEQMTPEQKELHDLKKSVKEREEQERITKEQAQQEEINNLKTKYQQDYQTKIMEAIDKSGLPKSAGTVKRIAFYMLEGLKKNVRLEPTDVVKDVRSDLEREYREMFHAAPADRLIELFGQDFAKKIRKHSLEEVNKQPEGQVVDAVASSDEPKKKLSKDEWRELIRKRAES